jgi:hypothetical protein
MGMRRAAALLSNVGVLLNTSCLTTGARCLRLRLLQIDLSRWASPVQSLFRIGDTQCLLEALWHL